MNLEHFFLFCFALGVSWTLLTVLVGGHHWHLPGLGHSGALHGPVHLHGHAHAGGGGHRGGGRASTAINPSTIAAFLAWFGGVGYLCVRHSPAWTAAALAAAVPAGLFGGAVVFAVLRKLETDVGTLDPSDFQVVGVLGQVSSPIRPGGVGEIVYSQGGTRRSVAARADEAIDRGTEVVVLAYERGVAVVRRLDELAAEGAAGERGSIP